jgi:hypothetical protein
MVATNAALVVIATTIVALALLTLATVYYVPKALPNGDNGHEEHDEGNEQPAGRRPA